MMEKYGLRTQAEKIACNKPVVQRAEYEKLTPEEMRQMIYELQIHKIELEIQNEELRRAQDEIDTAQARYFDFYDLAPVGYLTISENSTIVEANLTTARLLGFPREMLISKPVTNFIFYDDQDILYLHFKQLAAKGKPQTCELRMVKFDKAPVYVQFCSVSAYDQYSSPLCRIVVNDITDRRLADDRMKCLLSEKNLILKEVHHRIKNNMGTIMGCLYLQAASLTDSGAVAALKDAENRLHSMMALYDKLYKADYVLALSMKEYLDDLIDQIVAGFSGSISIITFKNIENIILDVNKIQPLGIIINELLTNIMKYAFEYNTSGVITIDALLKGKTVVMTIGDNGRGMPFGFDFDTTAGFGLNLVRMLVHQLKGDISIERESGTKIVLSFEL